ncbi:hypothetical protein CA54_00500 [Symmachiella macrocystis]|uniref:Heparinase II/III-like protein n=1 Tax=Symmachiella macrocystis TaxID=2527985 RepID=A0A5C6BIT4_9PLAN|nr:hypothetical protein CA54_00500 [Symmachiella macrocystis]
MKRSYTGFAVVAVATAAIAFVAGEAFLPQLAFDSTVEGGQFKSGTAASSSSAVAPPNGIIPLEINGRQWSFRTPPPKGIKVRADHPRLLITKESLPEVQAKLDNFALYGNEMKAIVKQPALQALFYAVYGDAVAGEMAKKALIETPDSMNTGDGTDGFFWCLVYDWCHDLFTPAEREFAMRRIMEKYRLEFPAPGESEFKDKVVLEMGGGYSYDNNPHEPGEHAIGFQLRGVIALAFYGDGVRDEWCENVFQAMLGRKRDKKIYPIYEPLGGGLLDGHNSMALDSGGSQAGNHSHGPLSGYNEMFFSTASMLMSAWESATGDELFSRDNFYRKLPHWLVYDLDVEQSIGSASGMQVLRQLTGIYKEIDPEMASLAAWLSQKYGEGQYNELVTLILGDKTVVPKSPEEIGLPTSAFLRGADRWYSQTGWSENDTRVELTTRSVDTNRYEPAAGLLSITSDKEKLLISGQAKKGSKSVVFGSGIWLWPTDNSPTHIQESSTYWGGRHLSRDERVRRASNPYKVATQSGYWGVLPTEDHGEENYHVFTVDASRFAYDGKKSKLDVKKNKRTVAHLKPVDGREFIVVYDRVSVGDGVSQLWGGRFMNRPEVSGDTFMSTNNKMAIHGTVLAPKAVLDVRGGPGKATKGPSGESYDGVGYIFKDDDSSRAVFGSYSLFIKPDYVSKQQVYCVVFEIGAAGFVPAKAKIHDHIVTVGGWRVDFNTEDATKVSRQ